MRPPVKQSGCFRGKENPFLFVQCIIFSYKVELEYEITVVYCMIWLMLYKHTLFPVIVIFVLTFLLCFHINTFLSEGSAGSGLFLESNLDISY